MNIFVTADKVGIETGGGKVTACEVAAMQSLGPCEVYDRTLLEKRIVGWNARKKVVPYGPEPWCWDEAADSQGIEDVFSVAKRFGMPKLVHFYAGTFGSTSALFRLNGVKTTATADAHDVAKSKKAHEELGLEYNYPHLTDPVQWKRYLKHYAEADVLIVPSTHSRDVMRGFGCTNRMEIVPHGCDLPGEVKPLPKRFCVGYLGAGGPDKGVRYLLEAWRKLNYDPKEAGLVLGGSIWTSPFGLWMIETFGGQKPIVGGGGLIWTGSISATGWLRDVSDFYNSISVYVQPSVTEGFGIEVLEAMAHGRPVICSAGAGVCDSLPSDDLKYAPQDVGRLMSLIDSMKQLGSVYCAPHDLWRAVASNYTWDKIQAKYVQLWKELLA